MFVENQTPSPVVKYGVIPQNVMGQDIILRPLAETEMWNALQGKAEKRCTLAKMTGKPDVFCYNCSQKRPKAVWPAF